jgi:hypothetical protein
MEFGLATKRLFMAGVGIMDTGTAAMVIMAEDTTAAGIMVEVDIMVAEAITTAAADTIIRH